MCLEGKWRKKCLLAVTTVGPELAKFSPVHLRTEIYEKVFPNLILLFPRFLCLCSEWVSFQQGVQLTKNEENP